MERTALIREPVNQAASPAPVFRIMLQDFSMPDRLHDFIQGDLFFNHLLLRVLRYPEGSGCRPGLDASEQGFEFDSVRLPHPITRLARPTGCRQGRKSGARSQNEDHLVRSFCSLFRDLRSLLTVWVFLPDQKPLLAGQRCKPWAKPTEMARRNVWARAGLDRSTPSGSGNLDGVPSVAGSIKIRVETISYFLKRYREDMVRRKQKQAEIDAKLKEFEAKLRAELDASPVVAPPAAGWRLGVWTANSVVANEPVGCNIVPAQDTKMKILA